MFFRIKIFYILGESTVYSVTQAGSWASLCNQRWIFPQHNRVQIASQLFRFVFYHQMNLHQFYQKHLGFKVCLDIRIVDYSIVKFQPIIKIFLTSFSLLFFLFFYFFILFLWLLQTTINIMICLSRDKDLCSYHLI